MSRRKISLDEMVAAISSAYGESLTAIVLYGSAASRDYLPEKSDHNLLIIVKDVQLAQVQRAAEAARIWATSGNPPPLTFTEAEWKASGDIFPMEYADVIEAHRVLFGTLAPPEHGVDLEHLRLQLEQEAMGKLLGIRQGAMMAGSDGRARIVLLEGAWSKILVVLRGVIRLHGEHPPGENNAIVDRAAKLASMDGGSLQRIMESAAGRARLSEAESDLVLRQTLVALEKLVSHVNAFRPGARTYAASMAKASTGDSTQ